MNSLTFHTGETLSLSVSLSNPGAARTMDVYLGFLFPNGDIYFFDGSFKNLVPGDISDPTTFTAVLEAQTFPSGYSLPLTEVFSLILPAIPDGTYTAFAALAEAGSAKAGSIQLIGDISLVEIKISKRGNGRNATLRVGGLGPYTTIQEAINVAHAGDTIQVAQGTYAENITIMTTKTFRLQGGWSADFTYRSDDNSLTRIDGGARDSVFNIQAGPGFRITIGIDGFTIQNGKAEKGGGLRTSSLGPDSHMSLTLNNNTIIGNQAQTYGGGIFMAANGSDTIAVLMLNNNLISTNTSSDTGGGIAAQSIDGGSLDAIFTDNVISGNTSTKFAGGIWLNSAHAGSMTVVKLTRNIISHNTGPNLDGGGVAAYASDASANTTLLLENNIVTRNSAGYGGGMFFYGWGNNAVIDVTLTNNIIAGNQAINMFGGIGFSPTDNALGYLRMTNNTVARNFSGDHQAGGVFISTGGGLMGTPSDADRSRATVSLHNDIVWGNFGSPVSLDIDIYSYSQSSPAIVTVSYSTIGSIQNHQGSYTENHCINSDPLFVDPSNLDFLLQDGSPAIDAGDSSPVYNDGYRPPGKGAERNDMGAYGGPNNGNWP